MKKGLIVFVLAVVGMGAADSAQALKWTAYTSLRIVPRPVGADDYQVRATGVHRVAITSLSVTDSLFPIRIRIDIGELLHNGAPVKGCGTGWVWAARRLSLSCTTRYTQEPCEDGIWDGSTLARLEGHPSGGTRYELASSPEVIDCACL